MKGELIERILELRDQGLDLKKNFNLDQFENYRQEVQGIAKKVYNSTSNHLIKNNAIALLDLPVDRSHLYRIFTVGRYHLSYLSRWNSSGKYEFYIDMVNRLLNAIIYNF